LIADKADIVELLRHEVARSFCLDAELSPILDELATRRPDPKKMR
jgi:hypothetical protein